MHLRLATSALLTLIAAAGVVACSKPDARPLLDGLTPRQYPAALEFESTPLPPEQVTQVWKTYLSGARLAPRVADGERVPSTTDYCADHTGKVIVDPNVGGATFKWDVVKAKDSLWNEALLVVNMDDPEVPKKIGLKLDEPVQFRLNRVDLARTLVYDSPDCGR
jgi:hypothetical protein